MVEDTGLILSYSVCLGERGLHIAVTGGYEVCLAERVYDCGAFVVGVVYVKRRYASTLEVPTHKPQAAMASSSA